MLDLSQPQRQSKKVIFIYLLKSIKSLLLYLLFAFFGSGTFGKGSVYILGFTLLLAITSLIGPILKYLYFKFHIEKDELILQKGWIRKERKAIPLERIQSINIHQDLVQRMLSIVTLEVETAGSKAKELEIPGLDVAYAQQLKALLDVKKETLTAATGTTTDQPLSEDLDSSLSDSQANQPVGDLVIMKLGLTDLLKVGITQNHLRSGGLALGVVIGFWYKIKDLVDLIFGDYFGEFEWKNLVSSASLGLLITVIICFLFLSVLISLVMAINKYWGFSVVKREDHLEVSMGLLNKREIKIPLSKVQILEFHSNPLRKLLGFKTAQIYQAQSESQKASSVAIPACMPKDQSALQQLIFAQAIEEPSLALASNPWSHARLNFYIMGAVLLPLAATAAWFDYYIVSGLVIFFLCCSCGFAYQYGKHSQVFKDSHFVVFQTGWLFPKRVITPAFKTQAVERWRSIFLKRRKEMHFKLHTAAGTRGLRYLKVPQVNQILNQINNEVILSERSWM